MCKGSVVYGQGISQPVRWQAQYTQIYSDDIETIAPTSDSGIFARPGGLAFEARAIAALNPLACNCT